MTRSVIQQCNTWFWLFRLGIWSQVKTTKIIEKQLVVELKFFFLHFPLLEWEFHQGLLSRKFYLSSSMLKAISRKADKALFFYHFYPFTTIKVISRKADETLFFYNFYPIRPLSIQSLYTMMSNIQHNRKELHTHDEPNVLIIYVLWFLITFFSVMSC